MPYSTLGSLSCSASQNPLVTIASEAWNCGTFAGYSSTSSIVGQLVCTDKQVIRFSSGTYSCGPDADTWATLNCTSGQIPKYGSGWACGSDSDAVKSLNCVAGQVVQWNGSAWVCYSPADLDALGSLTCTTGQIAKYNGTAWACADDSDTLGNLPCTTGQILKYNTTSTSWYCATDNNVASTLGCTNGQTITGNSTLSCIAVPVTNTPVTILIDGQQVPGSFGSAILSSYFGSNYPRDYSGFPIQIAGGFTVIGAGFNLNKDPRTQTNPVLCVDTCLLYTSPSPRD
eukprot:TRINITY_DN158_c0_g2_i2.p1 TRINITY_DN158_c0_g2~~TRINITY_DN158_c0_g2_i2.p1  ORF type:complete len:286 (-),score=84.52 TRINITY_DN158_c0_g2_i2:35-892(-)